MSYDVLSTGGPPGPPANITNCTSIAAVMAKCSKKSSIVVSGVDEAATSNADIQASKLLLAWLGKCILTYVGTALVAQGKAG